MNYISYALFKCITKENMFFLPNMFLFKHVFIKIYIIVDFLLTNFMNFYKYYKWQFQLLVE